MLLLLAPPALAQSTPPIRRTRMQDGREFVGEVLGTEASGLRVRVPPGEMLVSFEELLEVKPIDPTAYASQSAWRVVVVAPDDLRPAVQTLFDAMPGVSAHPVGSPDPGLSPEQSTALAGCAEDLACLRGVLKDQPWQWVVTLRRTDTGVQVASVVSTADRALPAQQSVSPVDAPGLWTALHSAIGLLAPKSQPPAVEGLGGRVKPPKHGPDASAPVASGAAFVPIPGWTGFKNGEAGLGAAGLVGTLAFTALAGAGGGMVVAPGADGNFDVPQAVGFGLVGYLGATWTVNHWLNGGPAVVPTGNGAAVTGKF